MSDGATNEADGESTAENGPCGRSAKMHKRPDFIKVPRAALKHAELDVRDALTFGLVLYRDKIGSRIGATEIAETFGWDRTTGWRSLKTLREVGLLDANDAPIPGALSDQGGFLKVKVDHVRELGNLEAVVLVQLLTYGSLRMCQMVGKHMQVTARGLASLIGCCADTALAVLKRLCSGLTNRVKRAQRKGDPVVAKGRLELVRAVGRAMRVRLLGEREQKPQAAAKPARAAAAPSQGPAGYVPSREELAAMLNAATRQRAT